MMGAEADYSTPVVMLGSGHHGCLGIARSLGRLGIPAYSADAPRWEPALSSRYCRGGFGIDLENQPQERAIAALESAGRKLGGRPILIPTTDRTAIWVAENSQALQEVFRFPFLDAVLVETLCDKSRMQALAQRSGVPVARSMVPRSKDEVARFIEGAAFPVMVKATDAESLRRRTGGTKFILRTPRELVELYSKAEDPRGPNLLIQEFIPGEDWMFNGYFDENSRCLFGVTGKKIRRFPVNTGVTSLGVCLANETVFNSTTEFMRAIGYRGILDIGYRYDQRDGRYKVLDVNPRIGCTFRLFAGTGGLDVARALYLDLTGQSVPSAEPIPGRKWLVEDFDLFSALRSWWSGTLCIRDWAKSFAGLQETACFALDDPLPFLTMGAADCFELYRWLRYQPPARKPSPQPERPVLLASERRS